MFYLYTETVFLGRVIRFIKAEFGNAPISQALFDLLKLTEQENPEMLVLIKNDGDTWHTFRNHEELAFWQAYMQQHPLKYDEYYSWTRELATL